MLTWPIHFVFMFTIPDCDKPRFNKCFPLTFIMCIVWIGSLSYVVAWMITIIGSFPISRCKKSMDDYFFDIRRYVGDSGFGDGDNVSGCRNECTRSGVQRDRGQTGSWVNGNQQFDRIEYVRYSVVFGSALVHKSDVPSHTRRQAMGNISPLFSTFSQRLSLFLIAGWD